MDQDPAQAYERRWVDYWKAHLRDGGQVTDVLLSMIVYSHFVTSEQP